MEREDKLKALDAALSQIERQYGKGAVMKLGDNTARMNVETVPTGSLSLDIALGLGGIPKGRIVEIYGPESSGKTTVTLHMIAEVQKRGGIAGFIDAEHALDPVYAKNIGVDIDNLYISQPDSGEQALEITETMVRSGAIDIIVVDSVAALTPKAEIDGDMGDSHVGLQARLMSQALRKLTAVISKSNCTVIFINQLREKVGVMFGNPETTTGGRAPEILFFRPSGCQKDRAAEAERRERSVTVQGSRLSRIRSHRRLKRLSLILCSVPVFQKRVIFWIWQQRTVSSIRAEPGMLTMAIRSVRVVKMQSSFLRDNPEACAKIEAQVRELFGLEADPVKADTDAKPETKSKRKNKSYGTGCYGTCGTG